PDLAGDDALMNVRATWEDPWSFETKMVEQSWSFAELAAMDQTLLLKGAAVLAYAESLKAYKKAFSYEQKTAALGPAVEALSVAMQALPGDADLAEISSILESLQP
ncbi:MAG: hypothetical protein KC431_01365, partial [Myxococcales bacterium]|nr:hypothetical protein [Myxococcales bacterium]